MFLYKLHQLLGGGDGREVYPHPGRSLRAVLLGRIVGEMSSAPGQTDIYPGGDDDVDDDDGLCTTGGGTEHFFPPCVSR